MIFRGFLKVAELSLFILIDIYDIIKERKVLFMGKVIKKYEELEFTDDFMFCMIMANNPKLCKELLELILGIKIKKVELADSQKSVNITYDGKGVRFDVYVNDTENTVYDIEMQTTKQKDLPKRTRYYQGMIDLNLIEKGMKYSKLKKSFVIFICLEDIFGKNLPVYTFTNICEQDHSIRLGDEATKVIVNASGSRDGLSEDMCSFLDFLIKKEATSEFTQEIQNAVDDAITKKEWEVQYMTMLMKIQQEREDAEIYRLIKSYKTFNASDEKIIEDLSKEFDLTREEAEEALSNYEADNQ